MFTQFSSIQLITKCGFGLTSISYILYSIFPIFSGIWSLLLLISIPMLLFGVLSYMGYLIMNSKAKNEIISAAVATNAAAFGVLIGGFLGFMSTASGFWALIPEHIWENFKNNDMISVFLFLIESLKVSPILALSLVFINHERLVNVDDMSLEELEKRAEELDKNEKRYSSITNFFKNFN